MDEEKDNSWISPAAQLSTAYLTVASPEDAVAFYRDAFGLALGENMKDEHGKLAHVSMTFAGRHVVMFGPEGQPWRDNPQAPATSGSTSPVEMYLYVPDVDAQTAKAVAAGAELVEKARDEFWGDRCAKLRDPDGYYWTLATKVGEFDPARAPNHAS